MDQKLFSESLQEFSGKIDNPLLAESILGLRQLVGSRNLRFYQWDEDSIALAIKIPVELPPLGNFEGIDIRSREPILIKVNLKDYPSIAPMVFPDRLDFPKDSLAHLYIARKDKPPGFCLVREGITEWYANKRIRDLYTRVGNWLRDAASGELSGNGDQFDSIRLEGYTGTMIYDYDQVASTVNEKKSFLEGANFAVALFERYDSDDRIAFKLTCIVTQETLETALEGVEKEREKRDGSPNKKQYYFGYIVWSDNEDRFSKYSVNIPEEWNDFKEFCAGYGIPLHHFEKQIAANDLDINIYVSKPVIVAVRRPKKIIGFSSDLEFFNFTVRVDRPDVENGSIINNVPMMFFAHGQPLNRQKANQISGSALSLGTLTLVAGCGALGSKVVMHFARSGVTNFVLTDPDDLSPHNLVRHALLGNSVGLNKAAALKREIAAIYPHQNLSLLIAGKGSGAGFLKNELSEFFGWILDFTASDAFAQTLIRIQFDKPIRVVKAFITDFGNLGVIYVEGRDRNPRIDDLEVMLYAQYKNDPSISLWLGREAENFDQSNNLSITIGVGCNSETTVLADDIVSLHSAYIAGVIKTESQGEQLEDGRIYINEVRDKPFFANLPRMFSIPRMEVLRAINDESWQIRMKPGLLEAMKSEMGLAMPSETGGVFVGCANYKTKTIHVVDLIKAPPDSKANAVCFFRGVEGLPDAIREINQSTGNQLGYIGEWHTHPFGPNQMSSTDAATIRKFKGEFNGLQTPLPVFLMIVTPTHILPYVY